MAAGRSYRRCGSDVCAFIIGILGLSTTVWGLGRPSQQATDARLLFPFRSYRDVQIFHFEVPHQTALATFQFKANSTARCPTKQVSVHLEFGSYPVANPQNTTFPPLVLVERFFAQIIHLQSNSERLVNISAPMSGDWFAAAFVDEETEQIVQKGIFRSCQVWLTATVKYYTEEKVISLVPSATYQTSVINQQFYRFFAPENTWSARINISDCGQEVNGGDSECPILLLARTKALPTAETNDGATNCSESPCLMETVPAENTWNYVGVQVLGSSHIKFDITVQLAACQEAVDEPQQTDGPLIAPAKLPKFMKQKKIKKTNTTRSASQRQRSVKPRSVTSPILPSKLSCWKNVPLIRNNLPGNFAYRFDLVPSDNDTISMVLNLTSDAISLLKFKISPIVDSGGTLAVEMVLPPGLNTTVSNISVVGCLRHGVHPEVGEKGECLQGWTINVNTSNSEHEASAIMIPYPQTGLWFLSMQPICYLEQHQGTNDSETVEVPCARNETEIIFQIKSAPCILGHCGDYGNCYQYISGGFIFSTCVCQAGWRGYGCTDSREALSNAELLIAVILLTLSNIIFVPAIVLALYRRFFTEACVYMATMIFSTLYHACDSEVYSVCVMRLSVLQFCDFYSAILSVWMTLIAMAELPPSLQSLAHIMGAVGVALGVEYDRTGLWIFIVPASLALLILVISWIRHCSRQHSCYPRRRLWFLCLLPGVLTAAAGLVLYTFLETKRNYQFVHSGWHAAMALSILFLLPERRHLKGEEAKGPKEITTSSYIRVEELSDISPSLDYGVYEHLLPPSP